MKVLMLGWEFPPMISGGLGVACYGLAKALNAQGVDVLFLLPKPRGAKAEENGNGHGVRPVRETSELKELQAPTAAEVQEAVEEATAHAAAVQASSHANESQPQAPAGQWEEAGSGPSSSPEEDAPTTETVRMQRVTFVPIDAWLAPYMTATEYQKMVVEEIVSQRPVTTWERQFERDTGGEARWVDRAVAGGAQGPAPQPANRPTAAGHAGVNLPATVPFAQHKAGRKYIDEPAQREAVMGAANSSYAGDLFLETERYARLALAVAKNETIDVVHAHDWMTFEAAMAVASETEAPLVLQIHSTELDRAGARANARIMEVERAGMAAADLIVAVSYRTKTQLIEKYGIDPLKIEVVYNATEIPPKEESGAAENLLAKKHKTVLFLGRLTQQKGPAYFLHAAKKVLSVESEARFILAGKGELAGELKTLANELGIARRVTFTGFLKKKPTERALKSADVYVMPSVSEPFGISSLEALAHDVPVIISKQSGVAEVLKHVLKVDFWDTDDLANKIVAILRHPPLARTLREQGRAEVRQLSWHESAERIVELYEELVREEEDSGVDGDAPVEAGD